MFDMSTSRWRQVPVCTQSTLTGTCMNRSSPFVQGLYLLLITNKQSNILEDLDTLRLLSKIVPEFAMSYEEDDIVRQAFELVSAFDEVISLGHKENISVMQVKQNCEMESHEEKLHKMIIQVRDIPCIGAPASPVTQLPARRLTRSSVAEQNQRHQGSHEEESDGDRQEQAGAEGQADGGLRDAGGARRLRIWRQIGDGRLVPRRAQVQPAGARVLLSFSL